MLEGAGCIGRCQQRLGRHICIEGEQRMLSKRNRNKNNVIYNIQTFLKVLFCMLLERVSL